MKCALIASLTITNDLAVLIFSDAFSILCYINGEAFLARADPLLSVRSVMLCYGLNSNKAQANQLYQYYSIGSKSVSLPHSEC